MPFPSFSLLNHELTVFIRDISVNLYANLIYISKIYQSKTKQFKVRFRKVQSDANLPAFCVERRKQLYTRMFLFIK